MSYAEVGDLKMRYDLKGEGHPLVMIIGLTATMDWWDPVTLDTLSQRYRLLVFDNRGAGQTKTPGDGDFTIAQMAGDTAGLMETLHIDSAYVLGISMGGMIAQELALSYPSKVEKLVLAATYCGTGDSVFAAREGLKKLADLSGTPVEQAARFCSLYFCEAWLESHEHEIHKFTDRYLVAPAGDLNSERQFMATLKFDACERLSDLNKPTLVAYGTEDVIIPAENTKRISGRIPGAKLIEYKGAGHGFIWERRDDFLRDLAEFLG
jgi:pimeloyl-ACP methyl ester carboxylesterase